MEGTSELAGLTGHQVVGVLRERYAEQARVQAGTLAAVWETVRCADADSTDRLADPDEWAVDEVRAALGLTRAAAQRLADDAHAMFHRLPELGEAMAAGSLDLPRARTIAEWTTELSAEHAHQVAAQVLPRCELEEQTRLTTGQLQEEIKLQAIALDPEWARRRYEGSLANRKIIASRTADGTAKLSGTNLPLEAVAAAAARYDALAKAAKRAGDPRPIDHLRADLYAAMNAGTYLGLTDDQILQTLLASRPTPTPDPDPAPDPQLEPAPVRPGTPSGAKLHVKVRLTTLLGLDRYPAELAGWGAIHAELARTLVGQLGAAQWRYTFTCPSGHFVQIGLTAARPTCSAKRQASCEAVVEILVPAALVPRLLPRLGGAVAGDLTGTVNPAVLHAWGPVLHDLHTTLTSPKVRRLLDPRRRAAGAALRREVLTAIDHCIAPGCRAPAGGGDLDHRRDWAKGGDTVRENLNPLCVATTTGSRAKRAGSYDASATSSNGPPASATSTSPPWPRSCPISPHAPNNAPVPPRTTPRPTATGTASAAPGRTRRPGTRHRDRIPHDQPSRSRRNPSRPGQTPSHAGPSSGTYAGAPTHSRPSRTTRRPSERRSSGATRRRGADRRLRWRRCRRCDRRGRRGRPG